MNTTPLVSVIIPFLNPGSWLQQAVESVLHQTYINWEVILIDDGSKQEDSNIAIAFAEMLPSKIFYVEHEHHINRGLTISRNVGITKAKGELIAFLDADDVWLKEKLAHQIEIFSSNPDVTVICEASYFWYSWKNDNAKDELIKIGAPQGVYRPPELMKLLYPLGEGQPPCPSGIIIKRDAFKRSGGFEERFSGVFQLYEDQAFLSKVYSKEVIYISATANNLYRKREDSMASAANDLKLYKRVRLFYLEFLEEYFLKKENINDDIIKLISDFKTKLYSS